MRRTALFVIVLFSWSNVPQLSAQDLPQEASIIIRIDTSPEAVSEFMTRSAALAAADPTRSGPSSFLGTLGRPLTLTEADGGAGVLLVGPVLTTDGRDVDPRLGTDDDLERLVRSAAEAGMILMFDVPVTPDLGSADDLPAALAAAARRLGSAHLVITGANDAALARQIRAELSMSSGSSDYSVWVRAAPEAVSDDLRNEIDGLFVEKAVSIAQDIEQLDAFFAMRAGEDLHLPEVTRVSEPPDTETTVLSLLLPGRIMVSSSAIPADGAARVLLEFRRRHPAIGFGRHTRITNSRYAFHRSLRTRGETDDVVVVLGSPGPATINVSRVYADDTLLRDAVTGQTALVSYGMARFEVGEAGLLLIEESN